MKKPTELTKPILNMGNRLLPALYEATKHPLPICLKIVSPNVAGIVSLESPRARSSCQPLRPAGLRHSLLESLVATLRSSRNHSSGYRHAYPSTSLSASFATWHLSEPMLPQLLEVVLLERAPLAEEQAIRSGISVGLILEGQ